MGVQDIIFKAGICSLMQPVKETRYIDYQLNDTPTGEVKNRRECFASV